MAVAVLAPRTMARHHLRGARACADMGALSAHTSDMRTYLPTHGLLGFEASKRVQATLTAMLLLPCVAHTASQHFTYMINK